MTPSNHSLHFTQYIDDYNLIQQGSPATDNGNHWKHWKCNKTACHLHYICMIQQRNSYTVMWQRPSWYHSHTGKIPFPCPAWCLAQIHNAEAKINGHHFADNIFELIFLNGKVRILIEMSLKFVPKVPINNILALVQKMAWCWPGDKPLSETMVVGLLMHICITQP